MRYIYTINIVLDYAAKIFSKNVILLLLIVILTLIKVPVVFIIIRLCIFYLINYLLHEKSDRKKIFTAIDTDTGITIT